MNHEYLNATHPAMLAMHRFNSDVQLPYRFPIMCLTCFCKEEGCGKDLSEDVIIQAAQVAQDAQAGYACDYSNKRQPMRFNEVKECCKGHTVMAETIAREPVNTQGKRHAVRIMNDLYGEGIVRGQVENAILLAYSRKDGVTAAEASMTCRTNGFYCRN